MTSAERCDECKYGLTRTPCDHCSCERLGDYSTPCECETPYYHEARDRRRRARAMETS